MEKVLILGVSPHLVVGESIENITPDVVKVRRVARGPATCPA